MNLSKYFQINEELFQIQKYLKDIIEKQRVNIEERFSTLYLNIYLINSDIIRIPLNKDDNQNYNIINNKYFQNEINYSNNKIDLVYKDSDIYENKNEELRKMHLLEEQNKNYKIQIEQFDIENKILKEQIKNLNIKNIENDKRIKDLENSLKSREKKLTKKKEQISSLNLKIQQLEDMLNDNINKDKIIELLEKLELKEKEIKEIKSRYPLELFKGEKLMSVIFQSHDQKFTHSFICKNTEQFSKLESLLYKEYPEYSENEGENYFLVNGRKIYRYKSLEENGIHNSDIIILNKIYY